MTTTTSRPAAIPSHTLKSAGSLLPPGNNRSSASPPAAAPAQGATTTSPVQAGRDVDGLITPRLLLGLKLPACVRAGEELCICELICVGFFFQLLVGLARDVTVTCKPCLLVSPDIAALQSRHCFKLAGALFKESLSPKSPSFPQCHLLQCHS